ncbi:MAG: nuclear transport factor 2 family protein [Candidatus Odinarchaeota archaeon]|nr:nuclear transport factor 2 family protein [Candidatus Odinarchaeota archaeon]
MVQRSTFSLQKSLITSRSEIRTKNGAFRTSRVTLIFLKKDNRWKIIHGHFSYMPK